MEEAVHHLVVVVVGASRGLGRALALELVRDLADAPRSAAAGSMEPPRGQEEEEDRQPTRPHARVVLASRDAAGLASTSAAINKQQSQQHQQHVAPCVLEVDLGAASNDDRGSEEAVAAITAAVQAGVAEARERGHAWRVVVVYAAGVHEPASVRDDHDTDGAPCWRYSRADDWSPEEVARWRRVNVGSAVALLSRLQDGLGLAGQDSSQPQPQPQGRLVFVYLSSQAAEERWWPLGNALYGPHKREAELQLARIASVVGTTLLCVRYPFVATEMADKLFAELLLVDAGLHADPTDITSPPLAREQVFLPLAKAAADTAALIAAPKADALRATFRQVEAHVFSYEPAHQ